MSLPYLRESKADYIKRMEKSHLNIAKRFYKVGSESSMWMSLLLFAMCKDLYGEHWEYVRRER